MDWVIVGFGLFLLLGLLFICRSTVNYYLTQKRTFTRRLVRKDIERIWQNKEEKGGKKN